jgi:hypothetical protein
MINTISGTLQILQMRYGAKSTCFEKHIPFAKHKENNRISLKSDTKDCGYMFIALLAYVKDTALIHTLPSFVV